METLVASTGILPKLAQAAFFIAALVVWFRATDRAKGFKRLFALSLSFHGLYAALLTAAQGYVWSKDAFTKLFLSLPIEAEAPLPALLSPFRSIFLSDHGYFAFYSASRFWVPALFAVSCALVAYGVFRFANRSESTKTDALIFALGVSIVGYPACIAFAALAFLFILGQGLWKASTGRSGLSFALPAALAALIVILVGARLVAFLGLSAIAL
ncbi:MAG: hypothetical protein HZA81_01045 [Candidatus Taylorbacteria bacterium]|nr:hypothetical protein [Candidatus Taylorbacteria bacterium]